MNYELEIMNGRCNILIFRQTIKVEFNIGATVG
jgi:hypothetical protein